jgi:glycosyltransferase involved in cell wall biosynthesis
LLQRKSLAVSGLQNTQLILFFTEGMSLYAWNKVGILAREIEVYKRMAEHLGGISFLTYGDERELAFRDRLGSIKLLYNRWGLRVRVFSLLAPLLYWRDMREATFLKTNQLAGARTAFVARTLYGKKMIGRCGALWTERHSPQAIARQRQGLRNRLFSSLDKLAFRCADRVVVTTKEMGAYATDDYGIPGEKIIVIPNAINTDVFRPLPSITKRARTIVTVAKLRPQKNLSAFLSAVRGLDVELTIVGSGPLLDDLRAQAEAEGTRVHFAGNVPNYELPTLLNSASLFVLPSLYEGHPKALLEAMACGLPVIGSDVLGIRNLIQHGETGYLCDTSPESIRQAIVELLGDQAFRARLGQQARRFVVETASVKKILEEELTLLCSMLGWHCEGDRSTGLRMEMM